MEERLQKLSALEELQLEGLARQGYYYLCMNLIAYEDDKDLWAIANNAALVCLSLKKGNTRKFYSVSQVCDTLNLGEIAKLVQEYQERFEEERVLLD